MTYGCRQWQQSPNLEKKSLVLHFICSKPYRHVISVKRMQPLDERTIQMWLLYDN